MDPDAGVSPNSGPVSGQGHVRVLLADDDRDQCYALRTVLQAADYEVREAHDGDSLMAALPEFAPHVLILDSLLPCRPGLECLRQIKADPALKDIHVIVCTGKGDLDYVLACTEAGASGFLHKPVAPDTFIERLRRAIHA